MRDVIEQVSLGLQAWVGTSRGMTTAHRHLDLELNYVLHGAMAYLIGGTVVTLPPQRMCALWGGIAHQTLHGMSDARAFWVTVPLPTVLGWGLPEVLMRHLLTEGLAIDDLDIGDEPLLQRWVDDLKSTSLKSTLADVQRIVLLELEARLRRLALRFEGKAARLRASYAGENGVLSSGLEAVAIQARFICDHYREEIGVEQIAGAAHLHPNYAMSLFRRHTGMTINSYLVLQRVAHAQRLLATTERSVSDIAHESGFGSLSRFYEAFQRQTGSTPRQFRQKLTRKNGKT